jgi:hypothetical protein
VAVLVVVWQFQAAEVQQVQTVAQVVVEQLLQLVTAV